MVPKKSLAKAAAVAVCLTMFVFSNACATYGGHNQYKHGIDFTNYKNVIVLIPDGCDEPSRPLPAGTKVMIWRSIKW